MTSGCHRRYRRARRPGSGHRPQKQRKRCDGQGARWCGTAQLILRHITLARKDHPSHGVGNRHQIERAVAGPGSSAPSILIGPEHRTDSRRDLPCTVRKAASRDHRTRHRQTEDADRPSDIRIKPAFSQPPSTCGLGQACRLRLALAKPVGIEAFAVGSNSTPFSS